MKTNLRPALLLLCYTVIGQIANAQNIFIITTDGFRWQEVYNGADSNLINNNNYVNDTALIKQLYWDPSPGERRKKLMPFFWNVIVKQAELYGNRNLNSKVNVKNPYKISYPGYNELLSGYADPLPVLNAPVNNRNKTILEYFNNMAEYKGKVAAFSSWYIFPFLLNTKRSQLPVNSGYQVMNETVSDNDRKISEVQLSIQNKSQTRYDLLTFLTAKEYIQTHHPKVVYLSFGETDEFAHQKKYDMYLEQANNVDKMIAELWYYVQTDPYYKNNTTFIITTDHGRGKNDKWSNHNTFVKGSGEIWLAMMGKGIEPLGEIQNSEVIYQNQIAATIATLLNISFHPYREMGKPINLPDTRPAVVTNSQINTQSATK